MTKSRTIRWILLIAAVGLLGYFGWQRFYGDRHAINLGFKGDTTASLLWRIQNGEVAGIAPKAAVVLIGANNLGRVHWSAEDTVTGINTIIAELHKRLPTIRILLLLAARLTSSGPSVALRASGFSTNTSLPAERARRAMS